MKFKQNSNLFGGKAIFIYGLVALIVVAYIFYFHQHIPNKQKMLHNKGITTLGNIEEAIQGKVVHYEQMVDQKMEVEHVIKNCRTKFDAQEKVLKNHFDQSLKPHAEVENFIFSDRNIGLVYEQDLLRILFRSNMDVERFNKRIDKINTKTILLSASGLSVDTVSKANFKTDYITWSVSINEFMEGLFDNELFECLVLIDENKHEIVYSNSPNLIGVGGHFEESNKEASEYGVHVDSVLVNSLPYQEFCREVKIAGKPFIILGLMSKETIDNYTKQVSYWVLLLLFFITTILIFSVPTIKIFVLNNWERMKDSDATFSAIGLISLVFFITLMITALFHYYELNNQTERGIQEYNALLMDELEIELTDYLKILDTLDLKNNSVIRGSDTIKYHEIFDVYKDSLEINSIVFPYDSTVYKEESFLNEIFTNNLNINKRAYINELKKGNGFSFLAENTDAKSQFFIQSVYSYTRGQTEAVISRWNKDGKRINCISTDLKSLMLSQPPEGFGYALIDKKSNVLFSSKKTRNNFRNLKKDISENGFIQRAIVSERPQPGEYEYGKDLFKGYIAPVNYLERNGTYPLYLITYADVKLVEWQTGVDIIITAACAGIIPACFIFLVILWRFTKVGEDNSSSIENKHTYNFLFPDATRWSEYAFLSLISIVYITALYSYFIDSGFKSTIVAISSTIIMYALIRVFLLADKEGFDKIKRGAYYFSVSFVLIIIMLSALDQGNKWEIVGIAVLNFFLFLSAYVFKRINRNNANRYRRAKLLYTISTFLWLVAGVISPIVLISDKSESLVENSFKQMVSSLYGEKATRLNTELASDYSQYLSKNEWKVEAEFRDSLSPFINYNSLSDIRKTTVNQDFSQLFNQISNIFQNRYFWQPVYKGISSSKNQEGRKINLIDLFVVLLCLTILYILIHYFFKRLFFNVPDTIPSHPVSYPRVYDCLAEHARMLKERKKPLRLFLVGSPRSKRENLVRRIVDKTKKIEYIDLQWFPGSLADSYDKFSMINKLIEADIIVIDNWYPCRLSKEYMEKINLITSYLNGKESERKDVVLLSNYTITQMEQNWSGLSNSVEDEKMVFCIVKALSSWIYNFREFVIPLENFVFGEPKAIELMRMEEINSYLNKSYYSPAYSSIWNSLTQQERFILYDLSDDDLLNTHDHNTLLKLYLKGLIRNNRKLYKLEAFQPSFRLFVKYGVPADELCEIEYLSAKNGSWKTFRIGLYLLILALLIFGYKLNPGVIQGFGTIAGGALSFAAVFSQLSGKLNVQSITSIFKKSS